MKNNLRDIKQANLAQRLFAIILDGLIFVFFVALLSFSILTPIANKTMGYASLQNKGIYYQTFSKLYVLKETVGDDVHFVDSENIDKLDSNGKTELVALYEITPEAAGNLDFYKDKIKYYYLNFKTNTNIVRPETITKTDMEECLYSPIYNKDIEVDGTLVSPASYYTETWFESKFGSISTAEDWRKAALDACEDFFTSSYIDDINNKIKGIQIFIRIPSIFISFIGFYIVAPLCFKNGETLGKKILHIGLITKDGYDVKKRQVIFRQLLLFVWIGLFMFWWSLDITSSIALTCLGVFIYVVAMAIPKTNRSPIDFAAYTYVIDTAKSVWFHDANTELSQEEKLDEKMSKYRKYVPENKHVIQVGSKVVDEQVKKELEEEKLKKNKK